MTFEETKELVAEEIKDLLGSYVGTNKSNDESCERVRSSILGYLEELKLGNDLFKTPTVKVEHEGPFVTVNFLDTKGNRLETLDDMLEYMGTPD